MSFQMRQFSENEQEKWNDFVKKNPYGSFLQSFEWGEFQKSLNRKIWRLALLEQDKILATALIIKQDLPFLGDYFYSPQGPIISLNPSFSNPIEIFKIMAKEVEDIAGQEKAIFWRMDPAMPDSEEEKEIFEQLGLKKSSKEVQPKNTLILDLTKSEEELLGQMHQKTRYNIRLAEKHGIKIQMSKLKRPNHPKPTQIKPKTQNPNELANFEVFWKLMQETARRDSFHLHPKQHYERLLEIHFVELFTAEYKNKIIVANVVTLFGNRATYLHGASDYNSRNLMAPYLLQWEQIKEAKRRGCAAYDFWGVDKRKWPGITRFKKGFGGEEVNLMGAWDLVFDKKLYGVYNILTKIKNILR